jgi:hypothetical protein
MMALLPVCGAEDSGLWHVFARLRWIGHQDSI